MSNYFQRLVARNMGFAEVVKPRLTSRFESPAAPGFSPTAAETVWHEPLTDEKQADSAQPISERASLQAVIEEVERPPETVERRTVNGINPAGDKKALPVPMLYPQLPRLTAAESRLQHLDSPQVGAGQEVRSPKAVTERESSPGPQQRVQPLVEEHTAFSLPQGTAPAARRSMRPSTPAFTPQREAEPTIKVTIGRVDVRAMMPTPPAPRPASPRPKPSLSLDAYLKQREEGKR